MRRAYIALASLYAVVLVGMVGLKEGPVLQAAWDPTLDDIRLVPDSVERTTDRLCYDWTSDKHNGAPLENVDVFLDRPAIGDRRWPEVSDRDTGRPWHRLGSYPVRKGNLHRQCVDLKDESTQEPLHLAQTMWFRGWYGLWYVPIHLPDINSAALPPP